MSRTAKRHFVLAFTLLMVARSSDLAANPPADQSKPPIWAVKGEVLVTNRLDIDFSKSVVTFIELGADRCIPCKQMQPDATKCNLMQRPCNRPQVS